MSDTTRVYLLTGFLGSGKTTLLNRIIDIFPKDKKLTILINEFGEIGVDGTLIEGEELDMMEISKGSIFCVCVKTDFIKGLYELTTTVQPDFLIIESTGVANPSDLKKDLELPIFNNRFQFMEQFCIIDGVHFLDAFGVYASLDKQIASSTVFIINKTDLSSPETIEETKKVIREFHPDRFFFETTYADIPVDKFLFPEKQIEEVDDDSALEKIFGSYKLIAVHAEGDNVKKASSLIKSTKKNKLYFCHISSENELKLARKIAKKIFIEGTPHHLFLTDKDKESLKGFGMMKPSLKSQQDQDALWQAVTSGVIDTVGSDHAPHTVEEKKSDNPPFGVPGVETLLPLMLDAVNNGKLSLGKMIKMCCENPASIFKIKGKGFLLSEYDADLVIVDLSKEKQIKNEELYTKCKWSPFNGKTLKGWPVTTIVNGKIVYDDDKISDIKAKEVSYYERESSSSIG